MTFTSTLLFVVIIIILLCYCYGVMRRSDVEYAKIMILEELDDVDDIRA